jgi:hypothetical protein
MSTSSKIAMGEVNKDVDCECCRNQYSYKMKRVAVAKVADSDLLQSEADDQAARIVANELQEKLEKECNVVPCPTCGAITRQMAKVRRAFLREWLLFIVKGVGLLMLELAAWLLYGQITILLSVAGAVWVLYGTFVLLARSKEMLLFRGTMK